MRHRTILKNAILSVLGFVCIAAYADNGRVSSSDKSIETIVIERLDSLTMERSGSLHWNLDEYSTPYINSSFFNDDTGIFYCFNGLTWKIDGYDILSESKVFSSKGLRFMPWSMNIISHVSIYVLDLDNCRIAVTDSIGNIRNSIQTDPTSTILPGSSGQPYVTDSSIAYVSSSDRLGYTTFIINRQTHDISPLLHYPEMYDNFYGALLMQVPYSAFNPSKNQITVGFPPDEYVYVLNIGSHSVCRYFAGSIYAEDMKPLSKDRWGRYISSEEEIAYFRENTTYGNLLYDRFRNLYYRVVEKSAPLPGVNLSNKAKSLSVIIMNDSFQVVGEADIKDEMMSTFRYTCFVSKEGLNLQLLTSDDELAFATYTVTEKPNNH